MSIFNSKIIDRFFDKELKTSSKFGYGLILILIVLILNDVTSFTYFRQVEKKISTIERIQKLKSTTSDSLTLAFLENQKNEVLNRSNVFISTYNYLFDNNPLKAQSPKTKQTEITNSSNNTSDIKLNFWFHLSAAGSFYFVSILVLPIMIFQKNKNSFFKNLTDGLLVTIFMLGFSVLLSYLCSLIPVFYKNHLWINYSLNTLIQLLVLSLFYLLGSKN